MLAGNLSAANLLTMFGLASSFAACAFSMAGRLGPALVALIVAGVADLFDGALARRSKRTQEQAAFGVQLDSLADMASFGFVPAVLCLHQGLSSSIDVALLAAYCCCAAIRLAYFNVQTAKASRPRTHFTGLPVTYAALIFPMAFVVVNYAPAASAVAVLRCTVVLAGLAFVSPLPIPKPRGAFYVIMPTIAVAMSIYWLNAPVQA